MYAVERPRTVIEGLVTVRQPMCAGDSNRWWIKSTAVSGTRTSGYGDAYTGAGSTSSPPLRWEANAKGAAPAPTIRFLQQCVEVANGSFSDMASCNSTCQPPHVDQGV